MNLVLAFVVTQFLLIVFLLFETSPKMSSPILWFLGAWWISLLMELIGPVRYPDLGTHTLVLTLVCILAVCLGYLVGERTMPRGSGSTRAPVCGDGTYSDASGKKLRQVAFVLGMLSLAGWFWGPLRILMKQPSLLSDFMSQGSAINAAIQQYGGGLAGYLQMLAVPALLMSVVATRMGRGHLCWPLMLMPIPALFLTTRRGYGIVALLALAYVLMLLSLPSASAVRGDRQKRSSRSRTGSKVIVWSVIMIVILAYFGLIQVFTAKLYTTVSRDVRSIRYQLPPLLESITVYASANLPALDEYARIDTSSGRALGYTLRPIYALLGNLGLSSASDPRFTNEFVDVGVTTNTVPFFAYWSFDLGVEYAACCSLTLGFVVGWVYESFRRHREIRRALVLSILVVTLVLSIRENLLLQVAFLFWLSIFVWISPRFDLGESHASRRPTQT